MDYFKRIFSLIGLIALLSGNGLFAMENKKPQSVVELLREGGQLLQETGLLEQGVQLNQDLDTTMAENEQLLEEADDLNQHLRDIKARDENEAKKEEEADFDDEASDCFCSEGRPAGTEDLVNFLCGGQTVISDDEEVAADPYSHADKSVDKKDLPENQYKGIELSHSLSLPLQLQRSALVPVKGGGFVRSVIDYYENLGSHDKKDVKKEQKQKGKGVGFLSRNLSLPENALMPRVHELNLVSYNAGRYFLITNPIDFVQTLRTSDNPINNALALGFDFIFLKPMRERAQAALENVLRQTFLSQGLSIPFEFREAYQKLMGNSQPASASLGRDLFRFSRPNQPLVSMVSNAHHLDRKGLHVPLMQPVLYPQQVMLAAPSSSSTSTSSSSSSDTSYSSFSPRSQPLVSLIHDKSHLDRKGPQLQIDQPDINRNSQNVRADSSSSLSSSSSLNSSSALVPLKNNVNNGFDVKDLQHAERESIAILQQKPQVNNDTALVVKGNDSAKEAKQAYRRGKKYEGVYAEEFDLGLSVLYTLAMRLPVVVNPILLSALNPKLDHICFAPPQTGEAIDVFTMGCIVYVMQVLPQGLDRVAVEKIMRDAFFQIKPLHIIPAKKSTMQIELIEDEKDADNKQKSAHKQVDKKDNQNDSFIPLSVSVVPWVPTPTPAPAPAIVPAAVLPVAPVPAPTPHVPNDGPQGFSKVTKNDDGSDNIDIIQVSPSPSTGSALSSSSSASSTSSSMTSLSSSLSTSSSSSSSLSDDKKAINIAIPKEISEELYKIQSDEIKRLITEFNVALLSYQKPEPIVDYPLVSFDLKDRKDNKHDNKHQDDKEKKHQDFGIDSARDGVALCYFARHHKLALREEVQRYFVNVALINSQGISILDQPSASATFRHLAHIISFCPNALNPELLKLVVQAASTDGFNKSLNDVFERLQVYFSQVEPEVSAPRSRFRHVNRRQIMPPVLAQNTWSTGKKVLFAICVYFFAHCLYVLKSNTFDRFVPGKINEPIEPYVIAMYAAFSAYLGWKSL